MRIRCRSCELIICNVLGSGDAMSSTYQHWWVVMAPTKVSQDIFACCVIQINVPMFITMVVRNKPDQGGIVVLSQKVCRKRELKGFNRRVEFNYWPLCSSIHAFAKAVDVSWITLIPNLRAWATSVILLIGLSSIHTNSGSPNWLFSCFDNDGVLGIGPSEIPHVKNGFPIKLASYRSPYTSLRHPLMNSRQQFHQGSKVWSLQRQAHPTVTSAEQMKPAKVFSPARNSTASGIQVPR